MVDKKVEGVKALTPIIKAAEQETIVPPKEYCSKNGKIQIIIDGDDITINIDGKISEDIGCYRNIKMLQVKFKENGALAIIPTV